VTHSQILLVRHCSPHWHHSAPVRWICGPALTPRYLAQLQLYMDSNACRLSAFVHRVSLLIRFRMRLAFSYNHDACRFVSLELSYCVMAIRLSRILPTTCYLTLRYHRCSLIPFDHLFPSFETPQKHIFSPLIDAQKKQITPLPLAPLLVSGPFVTLPSLPDCPRLRFHDTPICSPAVISPFPLVTATYVLYGCPFVDIGTLCSAITNG